ncbi:phytoene desaturase family protein [Pseudanabaena sp. PCC 6802]|uniref:phytoene desaturase family protein n=1 Tax=Pseudanabaena sp. PCC 6802 TaxID=118173 RepID=UPI00034AD8E4|nr:NAD(P)/FAD-dependent oxidoreductase [Pseudanabaena sp. PCC 6802]
MVAPTQQQTFDAIVIGSGIGGLTVAALLSKLYRKSVLVLEQHFTAGGFTHTFERKGKFHWDVGLHYVGDMGEGGTGKAVLDYLTNGNLHWQKMPDPFEKFVYPDFTFEVHSDPDRFQADLIQRFPRERKAIRRYFSDVQKAAFWFGAHLMLELFPVWLHPLLKRTVRYFGAIARETTQHYLDRNFQDAHLKALLASQWGDYGLPPSQSCFGIHGVIVAHYFNGGWYPVGGAQAIAQSIIPAIAQAGGAVITQRRVTEILLESGVAVGVKVQNTARPEAELEIYHAPIVVSDAGAFNTYLKLIPSSYPLAERAEIQAFPKGSSMLTVYLGLKESPQRLGFQGENHWIYTTYDHNAILQDPSISSEDLPKFCYLSFPSLKDPLANGHTAEIIAHVDYDFFSQWREKPWKHRGKDYTELKDRIARSLIQLVESHYPGFQDAIEYAELSTPLTVEHFDASDRGTIYGIPCIPERLDRSWIGARTPIKNLYLTGADVFSLGIMGAMMGGVKTTGIVNGGFSFFKIMSTIMRESALHHRDRKVKAYR